MMMKLNDLINSILSECRLYFIFYLIIFFNYSKMTIFLINSMICWKNLCFRTLTILILAQSHSLLLVADLMESHHFFVKVQLLAKHPQWILFLDLYITFFWINFEFHNSLFFYQRSIFYLNLSISISTVNQHDWYIFFQLYRTRHLKNLSFFIYNIILWFYLCPYPFLPNHYYYSQY